MICKRYGLSEEGESLEHGEEGGLARGRDTLLVEIPLTRFAADKLQRSGRVVQRPLHRRLNARRLGLRDVAIALRLKTDADHVRENAGVGAYPDRPPAYA